MFAKADSALRCQDHSLARLAPQTYREPITTSASLASRVPSICGRYCGECDRSLSICTTKSAPAAMACVMPST